MVWIKDQVEDAIEDVLEEIRDGVLDLSSNLFETLLGPIVGVPAPETGDGYVVAGEPANHPWQSLYAEFYVPYVLGLTFGLAFLAFAFVGLRSNTLSPYERKRLLRRLLLVTVGAVIWFPFVSVLLQFVDSIGLAIAPIGEMSANFKQLTKSAVGGVFAGLVMAIVSNLLLLVAAFGFALRYLGVVVLTLVMPLLGVLWSLDTWPLSTTAEIARKAAAVYPGLVLAGLPAAILFRIGFLWDIFSADPSLWDLLLALALIPTACIASLLVVYWSAPAVRTISRGGARAGVKAPDALRSTARSVRSSTEKAVHGGRNVHRSLSDRAAGTLRGGGQTSTVRADSTPTAADPTVAKTTLPVHSGIRRTAPSSTRGDSLPRRPVKPDVRPPGSGVKRVPKHRLQRPKPRLPQ